MKYLLITMAILPLAGCIAPETEQATSGMANPASEHCVSLGGQVEIRNGANGQVGYCHLPDGRVVEEWELFRAGAN